MDVFCRKCQKPVPFSEYWVDDYADENDSWRGRKQQVALLGDCSAQQGVQLTALRRGLAVSLFINVILLAVALYAIR